MFFLRQSRQSNASIHQSQEDEGVDQNMLYFRLYVCCFIYLFSILSNFGLIVGLKKTNEKLTMSQKLYIYLSITDAATGLFTPYFVALDFASLNNCTTESLGTAILIYTFSLGIGTFLFISYLRNLAIRKPFYTVPNKTIYLGTAGWNLLMMLMSLFSFFTYEPTFTSRTLYNVNWLFTGFSMILMVSLVTLLNIWSKRVLTKQSNVFKTVNEVEARRKKRNKTAVAILNRISLIYAFCILPLSIYHVVLGALIYHGDVSLLTAAHSVMTFMLLPLFPCSGLNALAYMLKDKKIRKFYKLCCKRDITIS